MTYWLIHFHFIYKTCKMYQLKYHIMKSDIVVLTHCCCASSCSIVKPRESYECHKNITKEREVPTTTIITSMTYTSLALAQCTLFHYCHIKKFTYI